MTRSKSRAARIAVMAAGAAALLAGGIAPVAAQQQQPQRPPEGWFKTCQKEADVDMCQVQQFLVAETGQVLTAVSLIEVKGKVNRRMFQVIVPSPRMIPPGVGLQIDGGQTRKLDYLLCFPDRCVAEMPLTDEVVNAFKRGQQITLTAVNDQGRPSSLQLALTGFTAAYDGAPLQQTDIDERRRQVEEFVNKNNEEFQRKLMEEQEKAKAGN